MDILWHFPRHGEPGTDGTVADHAHWREVAQAVDELGYFGAVLRGERDADDSWMLAAALVPATQKLRFLVTARPGVQSPTALARMAATLDRLSQGRVLIRITTGDAVEGRGDGLLLGESESHRLTDEYLTVWRRVMEGDAVDFVGRHVKIEGARLAVRGWQTPYPPLYVTGGSEAAKRIAASHADFYLIQAAAPDALADKLARVRHLALTRKRHVRFATSLHIVMRDTEAEARDAADALAGIVEGTQFEIAPSLWTGFAPQGDNGDADLTLIGDPNIIAARLHEYQDLGIDTFILSGQPQLAEARRIATSLFPRLRRENPERRREPPNYADPMHDRIGAATLPSRWIGG